MGKTIQKKKLNVKFPILFNFWQQHIISKACSATTFHLEAKYQL